ncbi:hypothetical protein D9753_07580 [Streptomyces dangxiongensis]|uniref:Uncharacterized protein n=1 Tax=Streptomyces dangxiongensis TaxID=1442032 RepID=A0A3G2JGN7_9ACTN|nr:hypothetical protein D9753_07580 [Streptomyces dangxiongensis]
MGAGGQVPRRVAGRPAERVCHRAAAPDRPHGGGLTVCRRPSRPRRPPPGVGHVRVDRCRGDTKHGERGT